MQLLYLNKNQGRGNTNMEGSSRLLLAFTITELLHGAKNNQKPFYINILIRMLN